MKHIKRKRGVFILKSGLVQRLIEMGVLVASDFKMAATAKPAIRGQKYFGWLTYSMVGLIDISFKKIGDLQFGSLFVT